MTPAPSRAQGTWPPTPAWPRSPGAPAPPSKANTPARAGNKRLKNALFLSAFAALHDPDSRVYYDRRRAQGKKHNAALICLARRRTDVIYAMLRDHTRYQPGKPAAA